MKLVIQAPVGGEGASKKENKRYATCPDPQEVKDCGTGLVVQVGKFQRSLKRNTCGCTAIYWFCYFETLLVSTLPLLRPDITQ